MKVAAPGSARRHVLGGTAWGVGAEALAVPTGIATVAFLTRTLGPSDYGVFSLAVSIVFALQIVLGSLLSRATIRFVSGAADWRPVATTATRLHVGLGLLAAAAVWLAAPAAARLLDSPELSGYLRLFAVDLPIAAYAQAHLAVLIGLGMYRERAGVRMARWLVRLALIVLLVSLGLGIAGAVLGSIGATLAEVAVARRRVSPALLGEAEPVRPLLSFAMPLFIAGIATVALKRIDLLALKALGGTEAEAGIYAAAQNIALAPALVASAFGPLLLASLGRAIQDARVDEARGIGQDFLRLGIGMVPFAALGAGAAPEIMGLLYGQPFASGGPALALLMFAGVALLLSSVAIGVLTALDRPRWATAIAVPELIVAIVLLPPLIARWGPSGAAAASLAAACAGVLLAIVVVRGFFPLPVPRLTLVRAATISVLVYAAAVLWNTTGLLVAVEIAVLSVTIVLAFLATGEISAGEAEWIRSAIRARRKRT